MSLQLDHYLEERAAGTDVLVAADRAGLGEAEARLTEKAIEGGQIELPRARAHARTREDQSTEETKVARDSETTIDSGEVLEFDAEPVSSRAGAPSVADDELRLFIERIERLAEERKGIADDIADVYGEAKARGYDKPTMRRIVRLRAMDPHSRQEAAALLETYADALGLQGALPL